MAEDKPLLVSSFISQGERTPMFDPKYYTTNANYNREAGQITEEGEKHLFELGAKTKKAYTDSGLLPSTYDPKTIFIRGANDNVSIMSGYAYLMGMYPNTVEGVDLMVSYDDLSEVPITAEQVDRVRTDVFSQRPKCDYQRVDFYPGNDDREFLIKPMSLYSGQQRKMTKQLNDAKSEFEEIF